MGGKVLCKKCNQFFKTMYGKSRKICPFCNDKNGLKVLAKKSKLTTQQNVYGYDKRLTGSFESGKR